MNCNTNNPESANYRESLIDELLEAGASLIERGQPIIPVNGKKPCDLTGNPAAKWGEKPCTVERLEAGLRGAANPKPHCKTGETPAAEPAIGFLLKEDTATDIEADNDDERAAVCELFADNIPVTVTYTSPRGQHWFFASDPRLAAMNTDGMGVFTYKAPSGKTVCLRIGANGKQVQSVIPPSAGREWVPGCELGECQLATLPDSVIKKLIAQNTAPKSSEKSNATSSTGVNTVCLRAMLTSTKAIEDCNDGSKRLYTVAMRAVEHDLTDEEALETITAYAAKKPFPRSYSSSDVLQRLRSAESDTIRGKAKDEEKQKQSTADLLVELALSHYRFGRTDSDEAFAVELDGPNVAIMLRGSRDALRSKLSRGFRKLHGRIPNSTALADAVTALQGEAYAGEPEEVFLRVAEFQGSIVIDLGDSTGRAIVVQGGSWKVLDRSPVLFRRTATTASLPLPEHGGILADLRDLLNVTPDTWPLVIGWLVSAYLPNIPRPILLLGGQQGTGKTTAAEKLIEVVDPSPAPLQNQPRDPEQWAMQCSASHVVGVDNVSVIPPWWSDALCKTVTGAGWLRRKLYTDSELSVLSFMRVVLLTSIDAGALRGDLGDRVLLVDLEIISESERRTTSEIDRQFSAAKPRIFGRILDLLARVWQALPEVRLDRLPRMADFAKVLAAVDQVSDNRDKNDNLSLEIYLGQRDRIAETVIESDEVAMAIQSLAEIEGSWTGTATELLELIKPEKPPKGWPQNCNSLGGRLKRLGPALDQVGVAVIHHPRSGKRREITITRKGGDSLVTVVTLSQSQENKGIFDDQLVTSNDKSDKAADQVVTEEFPVFPGENGIYDKCDKYDKDILALSSPDRDPCKKCRSTEHCDVSIHNGNSIRRDCAKCGHLIKFVEWNPV